jgi:RNase P subunit RPR2
MKITEIEASENDKSKIVFECEHCGRMRELNYGRQAPDKPAAIFA